MPRSRVASRGFTLVEMIIAVLIAGIGIAAALKVARTMTLQTAKGKQRTSASSRSLLIGRQLRSDLRLAGLGSSGAVAVDPGWNGFGDISFQTPGGGFVAISAITGANDLPPITVGGSQISGGSDALQLLVPNPKTMRRTTVLAEQSSNALEVSDAAPFSPTSCPMIYVLDQSAPTGVGRTQIAFVSGVNGFRVLIDGALQFTVATGSQVMCARLSTYWVDAEQNLRRTDFTRNANPVQLKTDFAVFIDEAAATAGANSGSDVVTPGALDLQIAYRVSAEAYRLSGQNPPLPTADVEDQWAFKGGAIGRRADELLTGVTSRPAWFEVRMVRVNVLARTLRKIEESDSERRYPRLEDGRNATPGEISVKWNHMADWTTISEVLTNLRYFDYGASAFVAPEPF